MCQGARFGAVGSFWPALALVHLHNSELQKSPGRIFGQNGKNSVDISKAFFGMVIWKFESSQVSQAVRRSEKVPLILAERPANCGLLGIGHRSPGSDFGHSQSEIADSLWRTFEKLPFLGDCGRRQGSICTAWPSLQCNSPDYPSWPPANLKSRVRTAAPTSQCNAKLSANSAS
jgi:hypothetical protein